MKKILFFALALLAVVACSKFDDSAIWEELNKHEDRIVKLETLCNQMNTNITSLQTIIIALQSNDYVVNIAPIMEGNKEIGYTITFAKSGSITIYHGKDGKDGANGADGKDGQNGTDGKDGKDGYTPKIGVKQHTDGKYYWTLDGTWLLDDNGNMIPAIGEDGKDGQNGSNGKDGQDGEDGKDGADGKDGKDGITPQLKIEDGYWYLSYDNGATWQKLGKATGNNGLDGDNLIASITQDEKNVYFKLSDGTVIIISKMDTLLNNLTGKFTIEFNDNEIGILAGGTSSVGYTITGATERTIVKALAQNGWSATVAPEGTDKGTITVTAPYPLIEDEIIILVYDGEFRTIMSSINFVTGAITPSQTAVELESREGTFDITVTSNIEYKVVIPDDAKDWLSVVETKSNKTRTITFAYTTNEFAVRQTEISLLDDTNNLFTKISVIQQGLITGVLKIEASDIFMQSNGVDETEFTVYLDNKDVTYDCQITCDSTPITDNHFRTDLPGTYNFIATYKGLSSNTLTIKAINERIPDKPSIMDSEVRTLISLFPYVPKPDLNNSEEIVNTLLTNNLTKDRIVVTTIQGYYNYLDYGQYFPTEKYGIDIWGYPTYAINNNDYLEIQTIEDAVAACIVENETQKKSAASLGIQSIIENNTIISRILIQATVDSRYHIGAILVEDEVKIPRYNCEYNGIVRHIDGKIPNGHQLGYLSAGEDIEYLFAWDLTDILEKGKMYSWSDINNENLRVVIYLSSTDDAGFECIINNVAESAIEIIN